MGGHGYKPRMNPWYWFVNFYNRTFFCSPAFNGRYFWVSRKEMNKIAQKHGLTYTHFRTLVSNNPIRQVTHSAKVGPKANDKVAHRFQRVSTVDYHRAMGNGGYYYKLFNSAFRFSWYFFAVYVHHWMDHLQPQKMKESQLIGRQHGYHAEYKWLGGHYTKRTYPDFIGTRGKGGGLFWSY